MYARVLIGLSMPCRFVFVGGFCFVEYYTRSDAEQAMRYINQTRLDDRIIRTDWDAGFVDGRQFGRGRSGGQVRSFLSLSLSVHLDNDRPFRYATSTEKIMIPAVVVSANESIQRWKWRRVVLLE